MGQEVLDRLPDRKGSVEKAKDLLEGEMRDLSI